MKLFILILIFISAQSFASQYDFIIMRHARAPGTGDPSHFKLGDCKTQRNLSADGIQQAKQLGKTLPKKLKVYSSQWCRCLDTARNLNRGEVVELPLLNSFYQDRGLENDQTKKLKNWINQELKNKHLFILVTHQVNITALLDVFPAEGQLIFVKKKDSGALEVVKTPEISIDLTR